MPSVASTETNIQSLGSILRGQENINIKQKDLESLKLYKMQRGVEQNILYMLAHLSSLHVLLVLYIQHFSDNSPCVDLLCTRTVVELHVPMSYVFHPMFWLHPIENVIIQDAEGSEE